MEHGTQTHAGKIPKVSTGNRFRSLIFNIKSRRPEQAAPIKHGFYANMQTFVQETDR